MANYHPNDELLMQFAAGQQSNALGLAIACHLETCAVCRERTAMYDRLGGELLTVSDPVPVSNDLLNRIMNKLDEGDSEEPWKAEQVIIDIPKVPRPLRRFVPDELSKLNWTGFSRNIKEFELPIIDPVYKAKFYKISAGKELPVHTHRGNEYTMVMQGSFSDNAGEYHTGDFILADTSTIHQPRAAENEDCICFAVMDAPLKMTGLFGRLLNPFMR
ncbi:MAG: ChrR family anti-sigma-E factor [Oleiphilaceae bacterium]|nr:ChrR family anti-sigma-E factor [Oleiphilaceae bacterium]